MIIKGLKAINAHEEQKILNGVDGEFEALESTVAAYIKEMTDKEVPGEWHFQQFSVQRWDDEFEYFYVVALFNPNNELVEYIGHDDTPYKSYRDAHREVDNGDYLFSWEELSETTARHTAAWEELDPVEECDCPPECKATMDGLW